MGEGSQCCSSAGAKPCGCPHHKMIPVLIALLGVLFLCKALGVVTDGFTQMAWPILVIVGGLHKMLGGMCKCCK